MGEERYERILREIFEAAERGRELALVEILARHPGHDGTAQRAFDAAAHYRKLSAALPASRPLVIDALTRGERLGDFEIDGPLASGGMGCVYRARQLSLGGRRVALKVLPAESAGAHGVTRFEREALSLAGLHHPHLAEVYGFGSERGTLYFAMRLVDGPTLRDVLERRAQERHAALTDARARRALVERIAEVADALALVHAAGLVHRDVKPSNIVLEGDGAADGKAVLVDFGLVRAVDARSLTLTGDSPSTPSYAPPEQILGNDVGAHADVFSLGVTLHDLVAARRPSERLQASAGLEPIRALVPDVDEDLAAVLARAIDPDARWRYPNAAALRDDLRAWLAGEAVSARRTPFVERARRWASKHPRGIVRGALLAVALVAASVGLAGPVTNYHTIHAARAAFERGDIRELARDVDALDGWAPIAFVGGAELAEAARRLRLPDESDALDRIRAQLDLNDMGGALFVAAESIGARDRQRDELIERFFIACGADEALHARLRPADAELWATLAARLLYEAPVSDAAGDGRTARLRTAVLCSWKRADVGADERRYLLTALACCGEVSELIDPVLSWTFEPQRSSEELRQGMCIAERILLRAIRNGTARDLDWEALWTALHLGAGALIDRPVVGASPELEVAARNLCVAALVATPAEARDTADWQSWVPRAQIADLSMQHYGRMHRWLMCMALARHEPLLTQIRGSERPEFVQFAEALELGIVAGLLDDEEPGIGAKLRVWCRDAGCEGGLEQFDQGRAAGGDLLSGLREETALDEDTLLGHPVALEFQELPRSAATAPPGMKFVAPPPPAPVDSKDNLREHENLHLLPTEALWTFHRDGAALAGTAGRVTQRACKPAQEGVNWFARLPAFGHSELRFDFEVGPESEAHDRIVVLALQTNGREYYPDQGRAPFELRIGDTVLATYTCSTPCQADLVLELPARWLRLGTNTLSLRLLPASTTPLRVWSVELKCLP